MGAPVVRTLVGICEQGVMGQVMYAGFARLLLFHGFLYLFSMLDSIGLRPPADLP